MKVLNETSQQGLREYFRILALQNIEIYTSTFLGIFTTSCILHVYLQLHDYLKNSQ